MLNFHQETLCLAMTKANIARRLWTTAEVRNIDDLRGKSVDRIIFLRKPTQEEWGAAVAAVTRVGGDIAMAYGD